LLPCQVGSFSGNPVLFSHHRAAPPEKKALIFATAAISLCNLAMSCCNNSDIQLDPEKQEKQADFTRFNGLCMLLCDKH